jgi:hypothetical protein
MIASKPSNIFPHEHAIGFAGADDFLFIVPALLILYPNSWVCCFIDFCPNCAIKLFINEPYVFMKYGRSGGNKVRTFFIFNFYNKCFKYKS